MFLEHPTNRPTCVLLNHTFFLLLKIALEICVTIQIKQFKLLFFFGGGGGCTCTVLCYSFVFKKTNYQGSPYSPNCILWQFVKKADRYQMFSFIGHIIRCTCLHVHILPEHGEMLSHQSVWIACQWPLMSVACSDFDLNERGSVEYPWLLSQSMYTVTQSPLSTQISSWVELKQNICQISSFLIKKSIKVYRVKSKQLNRLQLDVYCTCIVQSVTLFL